MLIQQEEQGLVINTITLDPTQNIEFKLSASSWLFDMLRRKIYKNGVLACVREIVSNALDAQKKNGSTQKILIHLPTIEEPWFECTDSGPGMTHQEIVNIYSTFGESTKTHSNDYIGAFGLGAKSPWAYADQFSLTVWNGGKQTEWLLYIDESKKGKMSPISISDCPKKMTGCSVRVDLGNKYDDKVEGEIVLDDEHDTNIRPKCQNRESYELISDIEKFTRIFIDAFIFSLDKFDFNIKKEEELKYNLKYENGWKSIYLKEYENLKSLRYSSGCLKIVIGDIVYYLEQTSFWDDVFCRKCDYDPISRPGKHIHEIVNNIPIHFNIGEIELLPSRDGFKESKQNFDKIKNKVQENLKIILELSEKLISLVDIKNYDLRRETYIKNENFFNFMGMKQDHLEPNYDFNSFSKISKLRILSHKKSDLISDCIVFYFPKPKVKKRSDEISKTCYARYLELNPQKDEEIFYFLNYDEKFEFHEYFKIIPLHCFTPVEVKKERIKLEKTSDEYREKVIKSYAHGRVIRLFENGTQYNYRHDEKRSCPTGEFKADKKIIFITYDGLIKNSVTSTCKTKFSDYIKTLDKNTIQDYILIILKSKDYNILRSQDINLMEIGESTVDIDISRIFLGDVLRNFHNRYSCYINRRTLKDFYNLKGICEFNRYSPKISKEMFLEMKKKKQINQETIDFIKSFVKFYKIFNKFLKNNWMILTSEYPKVNMNDYKWVSEIVEKKKEVETELNQIIDKENPFNDPKYQHLF